MAVMEPRGREVDQLDAVVPLAGDTPVSRTSRPVFTTGRHVGPGSAEPDSLMRRYQRQALAGDFLASLAAGGLAAVARFGAPGAAYLVLTLSLPLLWVTIIAAQRGYERRFLGTGPEEYRRILQAGLVMFCVIAVVSYALRSEVARGYVFLAIPATLLLTLLSRRRLRTWIYRLRERGLALQRVLVVGRADVVVSVIEKLDREPQHGLVPVGACVPFVGVEVSHVHDVPVVGDPGRVLEAVADTGAHVVAVVSHPDLSGQALRRLSWALEERGVELIVSPGIIEVAGPRLSIRPVAGLSLLHLERPVASGGRMLGKMVFDRVGGILLTAAAAPVLLAVALGVRLTSRGPVFYRQVRVGAGGREFTMFKFRSMVVDADHRRAALMAISDGNGVLFKLRKDPRVTRFGGVLRRFSLDELPQLLNVVRGDMSLVGPRPPLPEEVAGYTADAARRLKVKPGLTGLWQVSGRSDLNWEESLRLDLRYTDNWSIALDVSILWRTLRAVVKGSGAY
ncbi:sugar transferase [Kineosporia sp. J2-2]|uniref:Sugar transferase n=1 Tax=Kineosporia corallincola TaxID=2835133 RepID=A0ABS5THH7_9ACTN|nr:sugar transferase [Kineosporia corallincola]MBT0770554.1 sugar transferase [Kineosporia corallincola]